MSQARILPERYIPEQTDDGTQRPEINGDGSPQSQEEMLPEQVRGFIDDQRNLREARIAMGEGHRTIYQRALAKKNEFASVVRPSVPRHDRDRCTHCESAEGPRQRGRVRRGAKGKQTAELGRLPADAMVPIEDLLTNAARISNGKGFDYVGTDEPLLPGKDEAASAKPIADEIPLKRRRRRKGMERPGAMDTEEPAEERAASLERSPPCARRATFAVAAHVHFEPYRFRASTFPAVRTTGACDNLGVEISKGRIRHRDRRPRGYLNDGVALLLAVMGDECL